MAATAYAALTSLKNIIQNLHNHPSPPISIDEQQVQSLTQVLTFLQEFLQGYNSNFSYSEEADPLEIRIADAVYEAKYVIESKIEDRIHSRSKIAGEVTGEGVEQDLKLVITEMDLIKEVAMAANTTADRPQLGRNVSIGVGSSSVSSSSEAFSTKKNNTMVGFDDVFLEVLERLIRSQLGLQIIPITGMGGIGEFNEIPSDIGDISTLRWIFLKKCNESVLMSVKKILEEQEEVQGEVSVCVQVFIKKGEEEALLRFDSPNFIVIYED